MRIGIRSGDEDLYRLADRVELLRRLARKALKTMARDELSEAARMVLLKDLERTSLGRSILSKHERRST
ncbi:MAG TPA: hypothetical protein ENG69_05630 [Candidatus Korarchaeota archaeon]|nr:hypothetical protein [Candidatus Korarchaeota archaeon]